MTDGIRLAEGVGQFIKDYDAAIIDLWGVIHDGVNLYPGVVECLEKLHATGKPYAMLSNAPRRADALGEAMEEMGVPAHLRPIILSSGEATRIGLTERTDPWFEGVGKRCLHIGPARDENLFDDLDVEIVEDIADADLIINTGPWGDDETVADYEDTLAAGVAANIGMVCANPDLEVIRGGKRIICAGMLALRYEELGGRVIYYGKPKPPLYETCLDRLGNPSPDRVLAIGDSLRTDIAGATTMGMDSLLIAGGLHAEALAGSTPEEAAAVITEACRAAGQSPIAAVPAFNW